VLQLDGRVTVRQDCDMAHEMEPTNQAAPDVYAGADPAWYPVQQVTDRPEYTELMPLVDPDSPSDVWFGRIILPTRALALGWLWVTRDKYRFLIFSSTLLVIWLLWYSR
jgi:hypothetical protein